MITQLVGDRIGQESWFLGSQRADCKCWGNLRLGLFGTWMASGLGHAYLPVRSWLREGVQMGWI